MHSQRRALAKDLIVGGDETVHKMRLRRMLPLLVEEFGEAMPAETIRACADQMLRPYDDVPVRSFVLTLATRDARECLREGRCDPVVG